MPHCPSCSKPIKPDTSAPLPFCSERCKQVDLARWFNGTYAISTEEPSLDAYDEADYH